MVSKRGSYIFVQPAALTGSSANLNIQEILIVLRLYSLSNCGKMNKTSHIILLTTCCRIATPVSSFRLSSCQVCGQILVQLRLAARLVSDWRL